MEKDRQKTQNDLNILDKQFIQKIRREDFYFRIGTFTYFHWPNGKKQKINAKRRGKLKPAMREAFNTIKYFTELIHPGSVEPKPVRTRFEHQIAQIFKYQ